MNISHKVRKKIIDVSGYWIYKRKYLPIGADFVEDTENLNIPVRTIFDVGANYGQTALYYAENFSGAKIYSFEPVEQSYKKLLAETAHLPNVSCFQNAFGPSEGVAEIQLFDESQSQLNSLKTANSNLASSADKESISIKTIDLFLVEHGVETIDLLKIDTEGYEIQVLQGAVNSLQNGKIKLVICEAALSSANQRNTPIGEIIDFLMPFNFTLVGMYDTNVNHLSEGLAYSNILFVKI